MNAMSVFHSPERTLVHIAVTLALTLSLGGTPVAYAEGLEEPFPGLQEFMEEFGSRLEARDGEIEERLHDFSRRWEEEQERLLRETEELREQSERALDEFMERANKFLEENDGAIEQGLREMQESAGDLAHAWLEQFQEREEERRKEPRPREEAVEVRVLQLEHRPAREIVAELEGVVELAELRALNETVLLLRGGGRQVDVAEQAVRQLDRPVERGENLVVTFYIVAAGGVWKTPRPFPEHLEGLRGEMAPWESGTHPVLLDTVRCRTRMNEELAISSHLPDAPSGLPQGYQLQVRHIVPGRDGVIRLEGVHFEAHVVVDETQRPIQMEVNPDISPGQPTLLGSASVRGAGQAILLIGEITPVS